jgi:hypothetical protein
MNHQLPSNLDISHTNGVNLDERLALEHFLGKTLEEAEELFRENSTYYWEDLMWMGSYGFAFYSEAFFRYLRSAQAQDDAHSVRALCTILEFRVDSCPQSLLMCDSAVSSIVAFCLDSIARFNLHPEFDAKIAKKLRRLQTALLELRESGGPAKLGNR